jgi:hypothetical protein
MRVGSLRLPQSAQLFRLTSGPVPQPMSSTHCLPEQAKEMDPMDIVRAARRGRGGRGGGVGRVGDVCAVRGGEGGGGAGGSGGRRRGVAGPGGAASAAQLRRRPWRRGGGCGVMLLLLCRRRCAAVAATPCGGRGGDGGFIEPIRVSRLGCVDGGCTAHATDTRAHYTGSTKARQHGITARPGSISESLDQPNTSGDGPGDRDHSA